MVKRKGLMISALVLGAAVLAGVAVAQQTNIAIATGGTGGVYYPLGGGMANVLSKYVPGVQATARVTGGSVDNLKLIGSGQSEVALVMVDAALTALKGEDKFSGNKVDVARQIGNAVPRLLAKAIGLQIIRCHQATVERRAG